MQPSESKENSDEKKPQACVSEEAKPDDAKAEEVICPSATEETEETKDVKNVNETTTGEALVQASASAGASQQVEDPQLKETQQTEELLATARAHENFKEFIEIEKAKDDVEDDWSFGDEDPYEDLKTFNGYLKSIGKPELSLAGAEIEALRSVITFRLQQIDKDISNANTPDPFLLAVQRVLSHSLFFDFAVEEDPSYLVEWSTSFCSLDGDVGADLIAFNEYLIRSQLAPIDLRAAMPDVYSADEKNEHEREADEKNKTHQQTAHLEDNDNDNVNVEIPDVMNENEDEETDEFTDGETDLDFKYPIPPTVDHPNVKCVLRSATKASWILFLPETRVSVVLVVYFNFCSFSSLQDSICGFRT